MLRLGCCCYICKRWFFVDSQEGLLSSLGEGGGGGADILAPGLQDHFSLLTNNYNFCLNKFPICCL